MEGIFFVTDENNLKKYIQIDLEKYGDIVEDILDIIIAESRKSDEKVSLEVVKKMFLSHEL